MGLLEQQVPKPQQVSVPIVTPASTATQMIGSYIPQPTQQPLTSIMSNATQPTINQINYTGQIKDVNSNVLGNVTVPLRFDNPNEPLDINSVMAMASQPKASPAGAQNQAQLFGMGQLANNLANGNDASAISPMIEQMMKGQMSAADEGARAENTTQNQTNVAKIAQMITQSGSSSNREMLANLAKAYFGANLTDNHNGLIDPSAFYMNQDKERQTIEQQQRAAANAQAIAAMRGSGGGGGGGGGGRTSGAKKGVVTDDMDGTGVGGSGQMATVAQARDIFAKARETYQGLSDKVDTGEITREQAANSMSDDYDALAGYPEYQQDITGWLNFSTDQDVKNYGADNSGWQPAEQ